MPELRRFRQHRVEALRTIGRLHCFAVQPRLLCCRLLVCAGSLEQGQGVTTQQRVLLPAPRRAATGKQGRVDEGIQLLARRSFITAPQRRRERRAELGVRREGAQLAETQAGCLVEDGVVAVAQHSFDMALAVGRIELQIVEACADTELLRNTPGGLDPLFRRRTTFQPQDAEGDIQRQGVPPDAVNQVVGPFKVFMGDAGLVIEQAERNKLARVVAAQHVEQEGAAA